MRTSERRTVVIREHCGHQWAYAGERWQVQCPQCARRTATGLGNRADEAPPSEFGEAGELRFDPFGDGEEVRLRVVVRLATGPEGFAVESTTVVEGSAADLAGRRLRAQLARNLPAGGTATLELDGGGEALEVRPRFAWNVDADGTPRIGGLALEVVDWQFDAE